MIFQLIIREVGGYQYLINIFIVILARSLDILSTRYVTKELKLETNKLARKIGWKGMVLIQIPLLVLGALDFYFAFFIFIWSLFLLANNLEGSWYIRQVGENGYQKELEQNVKASKVWKIALGELSSVLTFVVTGILIIIYLFIFNDLIAVLFIALALILQGCLSTFRSLKYLIDLKYKEGEEETN